MPKSAVKKLEEGLKATKYHVDILWHLAIQYLEARRSSTKPAI